MNEFILSEELHNALRIRQYKAGDKEAVWNVNLKALLNIGIPEERIQRGDFDNIEETYLRNGGNFLVIELNGKIIAIRGYFRIKNNIAVMRRLRVLPEYQGFGVGKKMILALENDIKQNGFSNTTWNLYFDGKSNKFIPINGL